MKIKNPWGSNEYEARIIRTNYVEGGGLAIAIESWDEEFGFWQPYAKLTVNLNRNIPSNMAFVDVKNLPNAAEFIEDNNLGEFAGKWGVSGSYAYPLYKFF